MSSNCTKKCTSAITEERRYLINKSYQNLEIQEKKRFILANTEKSDVTKKSDNSKRNVTITYYLQDDQEKKIQICKKFFLRTLGYNEKNDRFMLSTIYNSDDHIKVELPKGGGKLPKFNKNVINEHISSFNPSISHYRREHAPNRRYLPNDISVQVMFKDFQEKYTDFNCSYELYRVCIKAQNISFTKLGHEECENCAVFLLHGHTKENLQPDCKICTNYATHIKKAEISREQYRLDGNRISDNDNEVCFSADLQKVIMLPRMDQYKVALFTPRIIAFNESFVPVGTKQNLRPIAVIWHEGIAGRKKEDIISTFHAFFF